VTSCSIAIQKRDPYRQRTRTWEHLQCGRRSDPRNRGQPEHLQWRSAVLPGSPPFFMRMSDSDSDDGRHAVRSRPKLRRHLLKDLKLEGRRVAIYLKCVAESTPTRSRAATDVTLSTLIGMHKNGWKGAYHPVARSRDARRPVVRAVRRCLSIRPLEEPCPQPSGLAAANPELTITRIALAGPWT
jgi:hypothetical protein